jgi:hypothetical protein
MFHWIQDGKRFLDSVIFSDEATFHVSMSVVKSIPTTAGSGAAKNPHVFLEYVFNSPEVYMFCVLRKKKCMAFLFMETAMTGIVYLDMLQQFLIPQLDEDHQEGHIHLQ